MKHEARFSKRQENATQQQSGHEAKEFANSDELLRFDAAQTVVPPEIAKRLQKSAAQVPPAAPRPWWKAWLGR
jgi:hypothetical protein